MKGKREQQNKQIKYANQLRDILRPHLSLCEKQTYNLLN